MRIRLLDLDGTVLSQPGLRLCCPDSVVVPLQDLAPSLRLWGSRAAMESYACRLAETPLTGPALTFIGSGDFHHLTVPLLMRETEPLTVLHFDNHPDCVRWPPRWHCGSWVNRALELPQIRQVVTLGPCSDDLVWPQLKGLNLPALRQGRLALWPWRHAPSQRLGAPPLVWTCLGDQPDWLHLLDQILDTLPTEAVWITIDKDVLAADDAITNWDQGQMPLSALLAAVQRILQRKRVVGADVCGDYSPPRFAGRLRALAAWLDHPDAPSGTLTPAQIQAANDQGNCLIARQFLAGAA